MLNGPVSLTKLNPFTYRQLLKARTLQQKLLVSGLINYFRTFILWMHRQQNEHKAAARLSRSSGRV
jgi:hypothetical protein